MSSNRSNSSSSLARGVCPVRVYRDRRASFGSSTMVATTAPDGDRVARDNRRGGSIRARGFGDCGTVEEPRCQVVGGASRSQGRGSDVNELKRRAKADSTRRRYGALQTQFFQWMRSEDPTLSLSSVTHKEIAQFLAHLHSSGRGKSVPQAIAAVRYLLLLEGLEDATRHQRWSWFDKE